MTVQEASAQITLGKWQHFRGNEYIVFAVGINATDDSVGVFYQRDGKSFFRKAEDFLSTVYNAKDAFDNEFYSGPRFVLLEPMNVSVEHQKDLLIETIKLNKDFWEEQKKLNPAFAVSGAGASLKYVVGDKIDFARKLGVITDALAVQLFDAVKKWS